MELLKQVSRFLDTQKTLRKQVIDYCTARGLLSITTDDRLLLQFMRHTRKKSISDITPDDVNSFRDKIIAEHTPYSALYAMRAIRCLFRYYKVRRVPCIDANYITDQGVTETLEAKYDIFADMKGATLPKNARNKELIMKRISDPIKWSWAKLGDEYGISRETAYSIFERQALKYVPQTQYQKYVKLIETTYA